MALVLGIETSCDETAAAVVEDGRRVLSSVVSSQAAVHAPYGGVVPGAGLAPPHREHRPRDRVGDAGVGRRRFPDLAAVAVTQGPGLVGSLLVGVQAAKGDRPRARQAPRARAPRGRPRRGGRSSPTARSRSPPSPSSSPAATRASTRCPSEGVYRLLGRTRDDAAGEAFDKVAKLLGLGYPGRPAIDRLAEGANDQAVEFRGRAHQGRAARTSRSAGSRRRCCCHVKREGIPPVADAGDVPPGVRDLVASFQRAVVAALVRGLAEAARERPAPQPHPDRGRRRQLASCAARRSAWRGSWACRSSSRPSTSPPTTRR